VTIQMVDPSLWNCRNNSMTELAFCEWEKREINVLLAFPSQGIH
jgi:hypothetical protein